MKTKATKTKRSLKTSVKGVKKGRGIARKAKPLPKKNAGSRRAAANNLA